MNFEDFFSAQMAQPIQNIIPIPKSPMDLNQVERGMLMEHNRTQEQIKVSQQVQHEYPNGIHTLPDDELKALFQQKYHQWYKVRKYKADRNDLDIIEPETRDDLIEELFFICTKPIEDRQLMAYVIKDQLWKGTDYDTIRANIAWSLEGTFIHDETRCITDAQIEAIDIELDYWWDSAPLKVKRAYESRMKSQKIMTHPTIVTDSIVGRSASEAKGGIYLMSTMKQSI